MFLILGGDGVCSESDDGGARRYAIYIYTIYIYRIDAYLMYPSVYLSTYTPVSFPFFQAATASAQKVTTAAAQETAAVLAASQAQLLQALKAEHSAQMAQVKTLDIYIMYMHVYIYIYICVYIYRRAQHTRRLQRDHASLTRPHPSYPHMPGLYNPTNPVLT